jgi:thymidylate kinase
MIIEFIGLMGAGKTTLHRGIVKRLGDSGRAVWTTRMLGELCGGAHQRANQRAKTLMRGRAHPLLARQRRLWFRARVSWWSRGLLGLAAHHIFRSGRAFKDKLTGLRWFLTSLGNHWKAREVARADEVVLIDEGLAQRVFNVFIHGRDEIDLSGVRQYARRLPLPDVLVYLTVNSDVATRRTDARSKKLPARFRSLNRSELGTMFGNAARALDVLVEEILVANPRPIKIIVIDTSDWDKARVELDAHIDALLARWPTDASPAPTSCPPSRHGLVFTAMPSPRRRD